MRNRLGVNLAVHWVHVDTGHCEKVALVWSQLLSTFHWKGCERSSNAVVLYTLQAIKQLCQRKVFLGMIGWSQDENRFLSQTEQCLIFQFMESNGPVTVCLLWLLVQTLLLVSLILWRCHVVEASILKTLSDGCHKVKYTVLISKTWYQCLQVTLTVM